MTLRLTDEQLQAHMVRLRNLSDRYPVRTHRMCTKEDEAQDAKAEASPQIRRIKAKGPPKLRERAVLRACLDLLANHPKVAFSWRQQTGAAKIGERYIKFGFKGGSDIFFVLKKSGRFGVCECKATGKEPTADQVAFLANVHAAGAVGVCVDDPAKLAKFLGLLGR